MTGEWVQRNPIVTESFKRAYNGTVEIAKKEDLEMGLGFDPIFDAQD